MGQSGAMQLQQLLRGYLVFTLTGSFAALGVMSLAQAVPMLSLSLAGGVLADRLPRKHIVQAGQMVNATNAGLMALLVATGWLRVEYLIASAVLQGVVMSLMMPARQAMIPDVVGPSRLMNAIALNSAGMQSMRLFAPGLGGALTALAGADWAYGLTAALYLVAIAAIVPLPLALVSRVVIATHNGYGVAQRGCAPWGRLWSVMSTRIGRPTVTIVLSDEERETLERWARRPTSAQALALRCRIVLAAAEGTSNRAIAAALDCHPVTVGKWRRRFAQWRLDGLQDEPRPGAPRTITDAQVEAVIVKTLEEQPSDATHWSTRSMSAALGMSQSAIVRIWSAFGLKPHLVETFKLSPDPQFIDKVRDVAGLYLNPPDAAVVLCVDEKTQVQALDRTAPMLPMMPNVPARRTHDYIRHGTTNLYAALDVASGHVITEMTPRHRAREFQRFLTLIDQSVPRELAVHVVLDNVSTHRTPAIQRWLQRHPRFTFHFTPTYSSWMNLVERWFAELTSKWLRRGTHHSVPDLIRSVEMWVASWNENPRPFIWHKTADQILDNLAGYLERIPDSGH